MSYKNDTCTCEWCRHSDDEVRICRRYPPVPMLGHSGAMRLLRAAVNHESLVVVESAFPATTPDSTCGEWAPETAEPPITDLGQEMRHLIETMKVLWGK